MPCLICTGWMKKVMSVPFRAQVRITQISLDHLCTSHVLLQYSHFSFLLPILPILCITVNMSFSPQSNQLICGTSWWYFSKVNCWWLSVIECFRVLFIASSQWQLEIGGNLALIVQLCWIQRPHPPNRLWKKLLPLLLASLCMSLLSVNRLPVQYECLTTDYNLSHHMWK